MAKTEIMNERLLSFKEVASRLGISVRAVYRLVDKGDLSPPVKVGGARRFPSIEIQAFIDNIKSKRRSKNDLYLTSGE